MLVCDFLPVGSPIHHDRFSKGVSWIQLEESLKEKRIRIPQVQRTRRSTDQPGAGLSPYCICGSRGGQTPAVPRRRPRPWQLGAVLDSLSFFLFPHFQPICWEGKRNAMLFNGATAGIMQLDNPSP